MQAVTATTLYHVKVYTSSADDTTNYWQVGTDAADTNNLTQASSNGSSWSAASYDLYFRLVDDTDILGGLFFTNQGQLYFVDRPSGAATPKLYVNGDRGVATGTHSATTLQDTTKAWTTNEWAGSIMLIVDGTNSEWQAPYRTIASNTADTLTFSPALPKAPVSNDTVYVILGSNKWTEITGHGLAVLPTSVTTAGDTTYFAQGDFTNMRKMREYVNNAAWTRNFAEEENRAKLLVTYKHPTKGIMVVKANDYNNGGQPAVSQAPFGTYYIRLNFPRLLIDCNATTDWTFAANVTGTADNTTYVTGNTTLRKSIKLVVAAGAATLIAYYTITAGVNIYKQKQVRLWIYPTENLAAGAVKLRLSAATDASTSIQDIDFPVLVANEWQQVTLKYTDTTSTLTSVKSFGILKTAASGTLFIDGVETLPGETEVLLGNPGEKITGLGTYGDPEVPWVFRASSAGSIENGTYSPIPLREMQTAENVHNGVGHTVHNVYLYYSFLHGLERFYRNNLDDVGPNRDEGLPDERRGFITSMQGYVGRFFENYDVLEGYSCIMESTSGTDHHEVYRCDTPGKRIRQLFIQVIPGDTADRLWFSEGDDIAWLPLPGNTLKEDTDDTFRHTHEAVLETGWIYGAEQDAAKIFHSVKLFLENATANRKVEWDYRKNDETTWTAVSTAFTTTPVQEIAINISAYRIKFRFRLQTNDNTETPIIRAMIVSATTQPEVRYTYTMNTLLEDSGVDIQGQEDTTQAAATTLSTLDTWVTNKTILTMNSVFSPFDNKSVFLEPVVTQPLSITYDESRERLTATLNLVEP